jgi:hypothetical protein
MGRAAALLVLLLCSSAVLARPAQAAQPNPCAGVGAEALLIRARAVFRTRPLPPYVVYTFERRETVDYLPDFSDTYTMRVWYRSADGAALTRFVTGGRARGPMAFEQPRFNASLDPGPPTADIFEPAPPPPSAPSKNRAPVAAPPTIATVHAPVEMDYRADAVDCSPGSIHLLLTPRRDPDRNRLTELWVEPATARVQRFIANDRLYEKPTDLWVPDVFDATFGTAGDTDVVTSISSRATQLDGARSEGTYHFVDIAFPAHLPDWYFEPNHYGLHGRDAPEY